MTPTARAGLLLLCALLLPACGRTVVKHETVEIPGPVRYVRIPAAYTDPITVAWALDCTWPGKDGKGSIKVPCTETMRAAYESAVAQCNADRAAVRDLSDRAVRNGEGASRGK